MGATAMSDKQTVKVGRRTVEVSNPGKVLFPDDGITKGDLVDYYLQVARSMLPHLRGRPAAMERYPDGLHGQRIFQKDVPDYFPDWIDRVKVHKEGGTLQQVVCGEAATLVYLANQACITPHVFLSRTDGWTTPTSSSSTWTPPVTTSRRRGWPPCRCGRCWRSWSCRRSPRRPGARAST
jgi:bifunctional non-homologous end joining protein LigD